MGRIDSAVGRVVNKHKGAYDIYIGRPSVFGNPFVIGKDGNREEVLEKFRKYAVLRVQEDLDFAKAVKELHGKRLGCFCAPQACHGDILLELTEALNHETIQTRRLT